MLIQVIGTGCKKCDDLYNNAREAIEQLGIEADLQKVEDLIDIVKLGVMTSPSLMIDGKLVVSGSVASTKKLVSLIEKASR